MEENKRLMIGCGNHTEKPLLMIVKRPQTKDKKMLYLHSQQIFYSHPPSKSPTINDKFKYNDNM